MIGGDSGFAGGGNRDRPHLVGDDGRDRLELGQQLQARLRLARLGGLGAEAVDEGLQVLALRLLLLGELEVERLALAALALEARIAAAVERELAALRDAGSSRPRCRAGRGRG